MTQIVHVAGLGWSGSGAVLDALLDTDRFISLKGSPNGVSESRLFSGRPRLPRSIRRLRRLSAADMLALWTAGTRVAPVKTSRRTRRIVTRTSRSHAINRKVFAKVDEGRLWSAAERAAAQIHHTRSHSARSAAYIIATYSAMRELLGGEDRMLLIDNDPGVTNALDSHLDADDHVAFIAVIRDPRDQYTDKRTKVHPNDPVPLNILRTIGSALRRRRELSALLRSEARGSGRLLVVAFEQFVSETAYREQLIGRIIGQVPAEQAASDLRFRPEDSMRNVGLAGSRRDAIAQRIFAALCAAPHRKALELATPERWPAPGLGAR